ncbi:MAG: hypothetical protein NUV51_10600, partial [Sulfuricaulis sp.]|nr:hypothetical protein [Sulfuricaulis sp.]
MTRLIRRENGAPLTRWGLWDNDIDRMFRGFLSPMREVEEARDEDLFPAMDVKERADAYVIVADVP